jgi:hypothetical protein
MARRKAAEWFGLVARWKRSGKTAEEFGAEEGGDGRSLHWWSWALRKSVGDFGDTWVAFSCSRARPPSGMRPRRER